MKKLPTMMAAAASFALATVASSTTANAGEVLDRVLTTKTLTVAAGTDWGALSFVNDKHELDGSDVDIAKGVAKRLGVEAKFVTPGWDIIVSGKWQGRWDLAVGEMVPTKARAEIIDFPAIYAYSTVVAAVHKDSKATTLSDLDGKKVGVAASTVSESYAKKNLKPDWINAKPVVFKFTPGKVTSYPSSNNIAYEDLRLGDGVRLDALVTDQPGLVKAINAGYPLKQLGEPLFSAPCAIAILPGDKEFHDKIAAAIQSMRDDGTLTKIFIKWYGVDRALDQ